jgi:pyruvate dehydrogenase E1 component beta subunit
LFFEHKYLLSSKGDVPDGEHLVPLGKSAVVREGSDITLVALAAMVPKALEAAEILSAEHGISATVIDLRTLVPLDTQTLLAESRRTGRIFTVEENPRLCGWGAEIVSIIQEQAFSALKQPIVRITTPHVPIPATDQLEDAVLPSVARIVSEILHAMQAHHAG